MNRAHRQHAGGGGFSSLLPFKILNAAGDTVCMIDGGIMACVEFSPPDAAMQSAQEHEELLANMHRELTECFNRGNDWSVYFDIQRRRVSRYVTADAGAFSGNSVPYWVDVERAAQFSEEPRFVTRFHVSLKMRARSLAKTESSILKFIANPQSADGDPDDAAAAREFAEFDAAVNAFVKGAAGLFRGARRLTGGELMRFLHSTFNPMGTQHIAFNKAGQPVYFLDAELSTCSFIADSNHPKIVYGGKVFHMGFVSIRNWPQKLTPAFQGVVNFLPYECRYTVRFAGIPREKFMGALAVRRSLLAASAFKFSSAADKVSGETVDARAVEESHDAVAAEKAHNDGEHFGNMNAQFMVWDEDLALLKEKLGHIEEIARRYGYAAKRETFNAAPAFVGSLPGEDEENIREDVCTLENAVYSATMTCSWEGMEKNMILPGGAPPLFYAVAAGQTPFMFSTHGGDAETSGGADEVGHTMIIGQTGGGKSTLLVFAALQFAKYGGRVIAFDRRRSAMVATVASGGKFYDFGKFDQTGVGVQPLRNLNSAEKIATANIWIRRLLADRGEADNISAEDLSDIGSALTIMSAYPEKYRTLAVFQSLVQSRPIKRSLEDYITGSFAGLFDAPKLADTDAWWTTYEIGGVLKNPEISGPLLRHLFTSIADVVSEDRPTLIYIVEAFDFLGDPFFAERFGEMLRQFRKLNAYVMMATQSLADLMAHEQVSHSVTNNILNRIFLPSPEISRADVRELYKSLGMTETHLSALAGARAKRDYFFHTPGGAKLASLDLREIALAFCAASNQKDLAAAERILADNGGNFDLAAWLRHKKIKESLVRQITEEETP